MRKTADLIENLLPVFGEAEVPFIDLCGGWAACFGMQWNLPSHCKPTLSFTVQKFLGRI